MKKILFSFLTLSFLTSLCLADCCSSCNKPLPDCGCQQKTPCEIERITPRCDNQLDDDEYCTYNQCFFDKKFRNMKKTLCLTKKQETCIDNLYRNFKNDMENQHSKYRISKNKILEMIECENSKNECYKAEVKHLKAIKKETKEKAKEYKKDLKDQLCKNQYSDLRKYARHEKKKMKKIVKYAPVYKFPCVNCCD